MGSKKAVPEDTAFKGRRNMLAMRPKEKLLHRESHDGALRSLRQFHEVHARRQDTNVEFLTIPVVVQLMC